MKTSPATLENKVLTSLGDLPVAKFLSQYWQQRPLLVRQAFAQASGFAPLTNHEILQLATYDEAESRLITRSRKDWQLEHGPFTSRRLRQ
jgi:50S ribosomal protein L16 3-hydroxylase